MSLELFAYLATLAVVYLFPNSRGSVGLLWALLFIMLQAGLTLFLPASPLLLTLMSGVTVLVVYLVLSRLALDPFADANVFRFTAGAIESLSKVMAMVGIAPESSFKDARNSAPVRRIYLQLKAQRWSAVETQMLAMPDGERYQLICGLVDGRRADVFDTWIRVEHRSSLAWVVSGQQSISAAWKARGAGLAHTVTIRGLEQFSSQLGLARADLRNAISLDHTLCDPYVGLLTIAMAEGEERKNLWDLFARVKVLSAEHYAAHVTMATALSEKWGGSGEEALDFARVTVRNAAETSALAGVLAVAHIECWLQLDINGRDYDSEMYFRSTSVLEELKAVHGRLNTVSQLNGDHVQALNALAFCFYKGGQFPLVREIIGRLQGEYVEYPWQYCVEPWTVMIDTAYAVDHVIKKIGQPSEDSIETITV